MHPVCMLTEAYVLLVPLLSLLTSAFGGLKCTRSIVDRFQRVAFPMCSPLKYLFCLFVSVQIVKLLLGENSKAAEGAACSGVILQQLCPLYLGMAALNIWSWRMGSEIRPKVNHQSPIGVSKSRACVHARMLQYCPPCASPFVLLPFTVEATASAIMIFSQRTIMILPQKQTPTRVRLGSRQPRRVRPLSTPQRFVVGCMRASEH